MKYKITILDTPVDNFSVNIYMILNTKKNPNFRLPFDKRLENKDKKNFELVITRFDENIEWSNNYKKFRTIYNKGPDNLNCECIQRPNFGRDGETILYHIINSWNNLADITFFCQGALNDRSDQMLKMDHIKNYIECKNKYYVFEKRRGPPRGTTFYNFPKTISQLWYEIFNEPYSSNYSWCGGMWISVRKEVIKNVPLEKYKQLLSMFHKYHDEKNDKTGRRMGIYLERLLVVILNKYNK